MCIFTTHSRAQVTKGKQRIDFFTIPEYEQWLEQTPDAHKWDSKYYKVLSIFLSTSKQIIPFFFSMLMALAAF